MLIGERVVLRATERADLPRLHQLRQQVELLTLQNGVWFPETLEHITRAFERDLDQRDPSWFGIFVADVLIGRAGLHRIERRDQTAAVGIGILDPAYLSQGYGREALGLLLEWGFRNQNYRRIWLDTSSNNERALRSYRACGFVEEGRLREHFFYDGGYVDAVYMGMLRTEWEAKRQDAGAYRARKL